ncbi:MAG TPA: response regulator transcription factor [Chloroflexi bacterium]|nr:response regulator transcription factor [Chloroflexota bacterium]
MVSAKKILVVDDEKNIRLSLEEILSRDGYQVTAVESGEDALDLLDAQQRFDVALVDLKMKGIGGVEVLKALRQHAPQTVVIILTAHASLETAVEAVRQGAHDYLFKPCQPDELRASIKRGLRDQQIQRPELLEQIEQVANHLENIRATLIEEETPPTVPSQAVTDTVIGKKRFLTCDDLIVDILRHLITIGGYPLDLTPTEFDMLAYLAQEAPRVVSPQELIDAVHGYESEVWEASETVRQHIYRLRQKIKEITERDVIHTVRGIGYTLSERGW